MVGKSHRAAHELQESTRKRDVCARDVAAMRVRVVNARAEAQEKNLAVGDYDR
jgi:hypothetical protein